MMIPNASTAISPVPVFRHLISQTGKYDYLHRDSGQVFSQPERKQAPLRLGLLVPFHGSDAIWGPSCQYSAVLAATELNRDNHTLGRPIELFAADAGGEPEGVVARSWQLVNEHKVDALIGVHLSSVRIALRDAFAGRVPYVFAPLYEGGETTPGVFAFGETPEQQFPAAIHWMMQHRRAKRWFIVGNDYIWPRASHATVRRLINASDGEVVGEDYISLGQTDIATVIEKIAREKPDMVFESLVGSDCVMFNRAFSQAGLSQHILRLSGSIEENTLFGIGAAHTHNLYCAASYFSSLQTRDNQKFMTQYRAAFGATAPVQGVLSQSCYDAIHFFSALAKRAGDLDMASLNRAFEGLVFHSVRGRQVIRQGGIAPSIYLAKADGMQFNVIAEFGSSRLK
ncbi:ABC transporter substrate-binding protein [Brenneria alni]|uniref:ABC transporter substrate-binding protein n=1 Tax=Brenneria alni TaxID=71656 RepID=A0A421DRX3_9GAMM|nr:substrate-binding domain-containing protein [Brenneria alni]RLM27016.1 ABC transporter substrate-binding protein [Brenneria alni]